MNTDKKNDFLLNLDTYVISLKNELTRRANVMSVLANADINFEFFDATEGSLLTDSWIQSNVSENLQIWLASRFTNSYSKNTIACADSHRRLLSLIEKSTNNNHVLILEDDIEIDDDFKYNLSLILKKMIFLKRDILFIGYSVAPGVPRGSELIKVSNCYKLYEYPNGKIAGAFGYIVNSRGAGILLEPNKLLINYTADTWNIHERNISRSVCVLVPKLVATGLFESTIGRRRHPFIKAVVRFLCQATIFKKIYLWRQKRNA